MNAASARQIASLKKQEEAWSNIDISIREDIENAVSKGRFSIKAISILVSRKSRENLKFLGYKIEDVYQMSPTGKIRISW